MKELHTIQQDGTDGGATKCNPKQGFGWNEQCMLLLRLKCRGGRGKDPNDISHGRATGLLHYRALDTKILSNEKTRSIHSHQSSPHCRHHLPDPDSIPFQSHDLRGPDVEFTSSKPSVHSGRFLTIRHANVVVRYRFAHLSAYTGRMQGPQSSARSQLFAEI